MWTSVCHYFSFILPMKITCVLVTVQPARNLHLNTHHRDLPQRVRWKWPPRSVFIVDISVGHRCSIANGSEHRATQCMNTADPDGQTRRSLILYNLHVQCRRWKTVDRDDPSRATTANPRVRSSRYARAMTTRVNGCSAAVFDRAWIILTTGVRRYMKVPRWLYCRAVLYCLLKMHYFSCCFLYKFTKFTKILSIICSLKCVILFWRPFVNKTFLLLKLYV